MPTPAARLGRTSCLALLVAASIVAGTAAPAAAQDRVPAAEVQRALFVAGDVGRLSARPHGAKALVLERVLQDLYARVPDTDPAVAAKAIQDLQARLAERLDADADRRLEAAAPNAVLVRIFRELAQPAVPGAVGAGIAALSATTLDTSAMGPAADVRTFDHNADERASLKRAGFSPAGVLLRTARLAATNERFGRARDLVWEAVAGQSVFDAPATLLRDNPALSSPVLQGLAPATPGGDVPVDHAVLDRAADAAVRAVSRQNVAMIQAIRSGQDAAARRREAETTELIARRELAAGAAIAALQDGQEKAQKVEIAMATISCVAGIAAAVAGNWKDGDVAAGVAESVVSLLELAGLAGMAAPSPEDLIIEQLGMLREQIDELRKTMVERFDELATSMVTLSAQLADLERDIAAVEGKVDQVLGQIDQVRLDLNRIEATILAVAQDERMLALRTRIGAALGYGASTGGKEQLTTAKFVEHETALFEFAMAADDDVWLASPPLQAPSPFFAGAATLLAKPLPSNVEFLRRWPVAGGGLEPLLGSLSEPVLLNPQAWALPARAYAQLLLENPSKVTRAQELRLAQLQAQGDRIARFVDAVGRRDTSAGTGSKLFNRLLTTYEEADARLTAALQATAREELRGVEGPRPDVFPDTATLTTPSRVATDTRWVLPWSPEGARQDVSWDPHLHPATAGRAVGLCNWTRTVGGKTVPWRWQYADPYAPTNYVRSGYAGSKLVLPPSITTRTAKVPQHVLLARRLGLGTIDVCIDPEWIERENWDGARRWPSARLRAHFVFWFKPAGGGAPRVVGRSHVTYDTECWNWCQNARRGWGFQLSPWEHLVETWTRTEGWYDANDRLVQTYTIADKQGKAAVETAVVPVEADPSYTQALAYTLFETEAELHVLAGQVYDATYVALSAPTDPVKAAADGLSDARELLRAYAAVGLNLALYDDAGLLEVLEGHTAWSDRTRSPLETRTTIHDGTAARQLYEFWSAGGRGIPADLVAARAQRSGALLETLRERLTAAFKGEPAGVTARAMTAAAAVPEPGPLGAMPHVEATLARLALTDAVVDPLPPAPVTPATPVAPVARESGTPAAAPPAGPTGGVQGTATGGPAAPARPTLSGARLSTKRLVRKRGAVLTFTLSGPGRVRIAVTRACKGKPCKGAKPRVTTLTGRKGVTTVRGFGRGLRRGPYVAELRATSPQGVASAPARLTFTVR